MIKKPNNDKPTPPSLQDIANYVASLDPLSGPNLLRLAESMFVDNGDGTMTYRKSRFPPFKKKPSAQ